EEGRIQVNKVARNNLRVKLGDLVGVHPCLDIKYGKCVHILPFNDSSEAISPRGYAIYNLPIMGSSCSRAFRAYRPVRKGDTLLVHGGMR
ncbi:hypothetical protein C8R47DRAFT_940484, partial [Mycena vitilis]